MQTETPSALPPNAKQYPTNPRYFDLGVIRQCSGDPAYYAAARRLREWTSTGAPADARPPADRPLRPTAADVAYRLFQEQLKASRKNKAAENIAKAEEDHIQPYMRRAARAWNRHQVWDRITATLTKFWKNVVRGTKGAAKLEGEDEIGFKAEHGTVYHPSMRAFLGTPAIDKAALYRFGETSRKFKLPEDFVPEPRNKGYGFAPDEMRPAILFKAGGPYDFPR